MSPRDRRYRFHAYTGHASGPVFTAVAGLFVAFLAGGLFFSGCTRAEGPHDVFDPHPDRRRTADGRWRLHDPERPQPPRSDPVPIEHLERSSQPPPGARVLFDGTSLAAWKPGKWKLEGGWVEIAPGSGSLETKQGFGSCRLHLEWWTPPSSERRGQNRGNSGVFLMGRYEIQILDTYEPATYADGMAGALYGVRPPRSNALRPAGQWQTYDIEFRRPVFAEDGTLLEPARVTLDVNGVRVHEDAAFDGVTSHRRRAGYKPHSASEPLVLQDHDEVVRFRNIWLLPLEDASSAQAYSPARQP